MKRLVPMYDNSGARYSIPEDRVDEFRADMGEVAEAKRYRGKDGQHFTIPQDQDDAFRADMPDAVPVRSYTMADGSRRDFTMSEMSKFLRSKEYRESADYAEQRKALESQMGSPTWAAVKGALGGAAEGAYYGGKNALAKVATALPEAAASVGEAVGNAVNLGGNAKNAVGDWLRASGQQTKRWLGENIRGDQYDENGNLVMSGLTKDLGYEDALTKIGETAGDAAAMAVKFAPAAIAGPAYMETILASDGINAFADTFDRAKAAGYSDGEANLAGAASGLINYYGAKLMMKGGAATKDIANPLLRALGGTAFTGAATAAQAVGNKGVENAIESKPITEGMLGAAGEGFVEGAQFHLINEVGTNAKASMQIRRETREMKEMRKENLLTATETPDGRAFLNTVVQNEGVDAAIRARKDGKDVSRKMGAAADLPDNMSAAERNAVIDGISKAREAQAERVRTKMDDVQAQSLADEIGQNLMGGASDPMFEDIWLNATRRVKNAAELDEPGARARIVGEAVEDVVGKQLDAGPANRTDTPLEKKIAQNRSRIGQEQKAQRKAELDEYERQEQERIAREKAEQDAQMAEDERARAGQLIAEGTEANVPIRESSEYKSWLRKNGRTDIDKNFNRYVAERGLDASLKVERGHNGPNEQTKAELEMGRRIEAQGEAQRANAQAKYDEEMTRREEAKAKAARAAKEKQVAEDWAAAEADRKAKAQEASRKGQEERARRKKEMAEYEFGEEVRKAQEAAEERGGKPSISVGEGEVVPPLADSRIKDYPEYASWIKKQGRVNNDKNWNKFVLSNGLDPRLTVERNRGPKIPEKPVRPDSEAEAETKSPAPTAKPKKTAATPEELKPLNDAIAEAKKIAVEKPRFGTSTPTKTFEVNVGTTTIKFGNTAEGIAAAERMAKKLSVVKDWMPKNPQGKLPSAPKPLKVASGKDVGTFDDVAPDFFAGKNEFRKVLKAPFVKGGYIYATDGNTLIRMKTDAKAKDTDGAPDVNKVFGDNVGNAVEKFKIDASAESVPLKQARAATDKYFTGVEIWRSPDGKIVMRSRTAEDTSESNSAFMNASSLKGHDYLGTFDPDYIEKAFKAFTKLGVKDVNVEWSGATEPLYFHGGGAEVLVMPLRIGDNGVLSADTKVQLLGGRRRMTDAQRAEVVNQQIADEIALAKANDPKITQKRINEIEEQIRKAEKKAQGEIEKHKGELDPMYEIDTATPADRTSDPAIVEWAKKRGETVATGADSKAKVSEETVRRFNADQIDKAVNVTKNLIKGVKVEQVGREWSEGLDNPDGADKSVKLKREGRVVGTYDPATKKVRLYSGADASTVYHELVGHAVHDWAKDNAKPLYEKLNTLAKDAPKELVDEIRRNYSDADEATIAKEIIAHIAGKKGVENITPKLKDKPTTWYAKAYVTVRDAILDFMQKIGFRRIDVKKMDSMTPMEAMDYLTEQAAKGRMLGKAEATGDGALTKLEKWAVAMYDRYMPITKVSKDAADAKALQSGKEYDFQLRNFDVKKKEFGRILAEGDIAGESVADYMRAQSAPERNRRLREEFLKENNGGNPSDYDLWVQNNGGSGWSDERAAEHMKFFNSLPKERQDAIKKAADFLWKMQKEGMERRVEAGLISREEADGWMEAEKLHIPWRSAIDEAAGEWRPWRGKNNFRAGESPKAKGRATEAGDPIAWMFEEFSDAHLRAIENETRSILARDIEASGKFGKVVQNTPQNQMKELRVKGGEGQANVVNFKRGGKTYSIVLEGERGDAIASSYTNRDLAHMPKKVQAFMRWWSSTATEWSPTFAVRNLVADNLDVARIVLAEQGVKQGVKTLAKYAVNRQRVAKEMWHYARTGEMKKGGILEQYSKEGGMIGGFQRQGYENLREQMSYENIRKQFEKDAKKGRNRTKSVLSLVPKAFVGIGHGIKTINTYAELSSRVAMFKTNVEAGMSAKDAALYSRRITVDFNRKGNYTPVLNTLFMFSNSTLGATMRQVEAIHKGWSTPQGKRAIALLFAQGLATAAAEAWINSDDDENEKQGKGTWKDMPEHNYTSRLGIRVGDKFYGLPGHDDPLSRISWLGSSVGRMFFGKMKKADFAKEIGSFGADMAGRFAGKGSTDVASGWNVLFPSAMQWFIQALENKDFAGRPIQRPKFDDAQPWSQNGRASTPQSWKTVAEVLNSIGGGNEARSGKLFGVDKLSTDFSPEMIRHVFNSVFKNVGRDAGDLISMAEVGLRIADFDIRNAPIARNLVTKSNGNDNRFFEAQKDYKADMKELKDRESWKPGERKRYLDEHPWLREGDDGKTTVNRLINMTNRDNPRSGLGKMGITQLRKLTEGKVRHKDGTYFEPNTPISDEEKERAKEWLQKRQARVIEIMGL